MPEENGKIAISLFVSTLDEVKNSTPAALDFVISKKECVSGATVSSKGSTSITDFNEGTVGSTLFTKFTKKGIVTIIFDCVMLHCRVSSSTNTQS